jgi:hypothetical protein
VLIGARGALTNTLNSIRTSIVALLPIVTGACSTADTCDEPAFYEYAEAGRRIEAPDDLDELAAYKEMQIPEASPRPPRPPDSGCIDRPPTLRLGEEEEDAESEST